MQGKGLPARSTPALPLCSGAYQYFVRPATPQLGLDPYLRGESAFVTIKALDLEVPEFSYVLDEFFIRRNGFIDLRLVHVQPAHPL